MTPTAAPPTVLPITAKPIAATAAPEATPTAEVSATSTPASTPVPKGIVIQPVARQPAGGESPNAVSSSGPDEKTELAPLLITGAAAAVVLTVLIAFGLIHYQVLGLIRQRIVKASPGIFGAENNTVLDDKPSTEFAPPPDDASSNDDDL